MADKSEHSSMENLELQLNNFIWARNFFVFPSLESKKLYKDTRVMLVTLAVLDSAPSQIKNMRIGIFFTLV